MSADRPPWLTPIQYDDAPAPAAPPGGAEDDDMARPGPHDAILDVEDDDEADPVGPDPDLDLPDDDIE